MIGIDHLAAVVPDDAFPKLTTEDFAELAEAPRDGLAHFCLEHATCLLGEMPDALMFWEEDDEVQGWCRQCGGRVALDPATCSSDSTAWWLIVAVGLVIGEDQDVFLTDDYVPSPAFQKCLHRLWAALQVSSMLDQAARSGVAH